MRLIGAEEYGQLFRRISVVWTEEYQSLFYLKKVMVQSFAQCLSCDRRLKGENGRSGVNSIEREIKNSIIYLETRD